jgi:hypothetical protein
MLSKLLLALLIPAAFSQAEPKKEKKLHVMILDNKMPAEPFQKGGAEVHPGAKAEGGVSMRSPNKLETIFKETGLQRYVSDWDQMEKDMYAMTVENQPIEEVAKQYPKIPKDLSLQLRERLKKK